MTFKKQPPSGGGKEYEPIEKKPKPPQIIQPYKHDCDQCIFVGWGQDGERHTNIYLCLQPSGFHNVIIRYSDEGPDYRCYSVGVVKGPIEVKS